MEFLKFLDEAITFGVVLAGLFFAGALFFANEACRPHRDALRDETKHK